MTQSSGRCKTEGRSAGRDRLPSSAVRSCRNALLVLETNRSDDSSEISRVSLRRGKIFVQAECNGQYVRDESLSRHSDHELVRPTFLVSDASIVIARTPGLDSDGAELMNFFRGKI